MSQKPQPGRQFRWTGVGSTEAGTAVIDSVRSDRTEGFSPEVEDYAASWLEATGVEGSRAGVHFLVLLATDEKTYIDGMQVTVQFL